MATPKHFTVTTLNTFFGRTLRSPDGLKQVVDSDILLLQEVFTHDREELEPYLRDAGFELVGMGNHFGLAIALRVGSDITFKPESLYAVILEDIGWFERALARKYSRQHLRFQDRGILAAKFLVPQHGEITVATTHLPVVTSPGRRSRFLLKATDELQNSYYDKTLILGGDMNHYPGPRKVDVAFRQKLRLSGVDLQGGYTWPSKKTGYLESKVGRFYGGQLDDVLYRGSVTPTAVDLIDVPSDHRAIKVTFSAG